MNRWTCVSRDNYTWCNPNYVEWKLLSQTQKPLKVKMFKEYRENQSLKIKNNVKVVIIYTCKLTNNW